MADFAVVAASIIPGANASIQSGTAGATITQGQALYIDTANSNVLKLAYNAGTLLEGTVAGIALNGGASGQVIRYVTEDPALILGVTTPTLTVGDAIYLGGVAGGMTATTVDLDTGEYMSLMGIISVITSGATGAMNMKITRSGAARTTNQI